MKSEKYIFQDEKIKIEIMKDTVGWYLIAYHYPFDIPFCDYLQDTLKDIFEDAHEKFGINQSQFIKIEHK